MISTRTLSRASVTLGLVIVCVEPARAQFTPIMQPDAAFTTGTAVLPITDPDFTAVSSLTDGTVTVSFDISLVALTVPSAWGTWGAPPDTETATPRVLWTNGFTSLTLTLSAPLMLFGFEAQPNTLAVLPVTASFFSGMSPVGQIMLNVDGDGGARLFAASSTTAFDSVVVTSTGDFAIAQVRVGSPGPAFTPSQSPTTTPSPSGTPTSTPTTTSPPTPGGPGSACTSPTDCTGGLFCVDGVCCTSICDEPLERCDVPPNPGTCTAVAARAPAVSPTGLLIGFGVLVTVAALALRRRGVGRDVNPD